jgi:hypothetical protein
MTDEQLKSLQTKFRKEKLNKLTEERNKYGRYPVDDARNCPNCGNGMKQKATLFAGEGIIEDTLWQCLYCKNIEIL